MRLTDISPDELREVYKKSSKKERKEFLNILFSDPTIRTYAYELYLTHANLEISKRIIFTELI
jgi:hypothetical protein